MEVLSEQAIEHSAPGLFDSLCQRLLWGIFRGLTLRLAHQPDPKRVLSPGLGLETHEELILGHATVLAVQRPPLLRLILERQFLHS